MNRARHAAAILACVATAASPACAATGRDVVADFDEATGGALPKAIHIADETHARGARSPGDQLVVLDAVDADVSFPDRSHARMYHATWNGESALATRSGSHLDVTIASAEGLRIVGFDVDERDAHRLREGTPLPTTSTSAPSDPHAARVRRDVSFLDPQDQRPILTFWVFLHDDTAGVSQQHIHAGYVAWWLADMRRQLPGYRLRTFYLDHHEGMTDIAYGDRPGGMWRWTSAAHAYAVEAQLPEQVPAHPYRFILLTRDYVAPSTMGLAVQGGDQAMASLAGPWSIVAHELGHTLGASHDDAAVWWSYVWPCETNMYPTDHVMLSNCYRYTAANETRIQARLSQIPTVTPPSDLSAIQMNLVD